MFKDMKRSIYLAAALLALAACNKDNVKEDYSQYSLTVSPVITRATETNFESGDAIGLSVIRETGSFADNAKLTYDGSQFKGPLNWYSDGDVTATLKAYYPYSSSFPASFTVQTDQSAGTSASDFLSAVKEGVKPTAEAVTMVFKHKFSRLNITLTNKATKEVGAVSLKGLIPTARIDAQTLEATVDANAAAAEIKPFGSGTSYAAIVPPQKAAITVGVSVAGVDLTDNTLDATLEAGKSYSINVIVTDTKIAVVLAGEIENWGEGGEIGGGVQFEEKLADGYFTYDNVRYNVVKLKDGNWWMAQPLAYLPKGKTPSSDPNDGNGIWFTYTSDGKTVTPASDGKNGYLYDAATALGAEITNDNYKSFEGAQGLCPKGWHIPTRTEFFNLVGLSNKATDESAAPVNENAAYYDKEYGAGRITTLDADGFNFAFTGCVIKGSATATGSYNKLIVDSSVSTVEAYMGKPRMNYILSSTGYNATATNIQFFALMSTFTSVYKEGRLNVPFSGYLNGTEVRCIRDAQ